MKRSVRLCLALLLLATPWVNASSLTFSVSGLQGEAERNVLVWLGPEPESDQDRRNFVVSVRDRVEQSLQALGYYQPAIDIDIMRTEPTWSVKIAVEPGEPVRIRKIDLQILGEAGSDDAFTQLLANTGLSQGDVLHHGRFERFRDSLLSLGQQRGYFDARIARSRVEVDASAGTADIFIHFDSGRRYRFGDRVYDQELADSELLEALATFAPGDYFEQSRLQELQAQLQRTGFYSSILVRPLREQVEDGLVPIAITLQAAKRHSFEAGIGYGTDTEERLSLTWRTPRINRYDHSQITRLEYSRVNPSGRFTYNIPLGNPLDDVLQLWARIEENEFGDLDSRQKELGTRREIRNGKWVYGYSLRGLNESWDVLQESATNDYLLAGISLSSRSHRGSLVDPASGFNQLYTLEAGNQEFGSDVDLLRFTANLRYIATPAPRHRLVSRTELGVAEIANGDRTDLAPSLNFFAGGSRSIRGFSYQSLGNEIDVTRDNGSTKTLVVGGDRLFTTSLEYQYYFTDKWRGALFADGGDAFDSGEFDWNYAAGFGIHFISPVGALRIELANSLSEDNPDWYLHLNIGAEF